ncbi:hypothetical protein [Actinomadura formosensis]|uniref:hypothetical protein n=1 Tax=Actinomadura formosensis TaxID=60706 RepID=UPI00083214B7|nr:hypothetical protein [Actinomadura formosensis]
MRRQTFAVLALVPALALGAQGCGGDGKGAKAAGTAKAADDHEKMRRFAQCMRDNGVDMQDPQDGKLTIRASGKPGEGGGPGGDDKVEAAQKKCRHLMPNGGKPPKPNPEQIAQMRGLSKCMRDHGITEFPDPDPNGGIKIQAGKGTGLDPESPKFKDAQKACAKFEPDAPSTTTGRD